MAGEKLHDLEGKRVVKTGAAQVRRKERDASCFSYEMATGTRVGKPWVVCHVLAGGGDLKVRRKGVGASGEEGKWKESVTLAIGAWWWWWCP